MLELDRMKDTMDKMEQERAEMVAEVEAQIERALASMAVDIDDSDYGGSRPHSRLSNMSGSRSRRPSDAAKPRYHRSFGTESTLAESYGDEIEALEESSSADKLDRENTIIEEDEEDITLTRRKRFSASEMDGMNAVDEGISQKGDKIAQKVLEIQQKVCQDAYQALFCFNNISQLETALNTDRRGTKWKSRPGQESGEEELSEVGSTRSKPSRSRRHHSKPRSNARARSGTNSSTQTNTPTVHAEDIVRTTSPHKNHSSVPVEPDTKTPTRNSFLDASQDEQRESEPVPSLPISKTDPEEKPSVARPSPVGLTDDSDTDFQSAYSASPRESYGSFDGEQGNFDIVNDTLTLSRENVEDRLSAAPKTRRERVSSTSTAIIIRESTEPRPNIPTNVIASRSRVASKV